MGLKQGATHDGRLHQWLGKGPISETEVKSRQKLVLYPSHIDMDVNRLTKEHRDVGQGEAQIREVEWAGCIRLGWPRAQKCMHAHFVYITNSTSRFIHHHIQESAEGVAVNLEGHVHTKENKLPNFRPLCLRWYTKATSPQGCRMWSLRARTEARYLILRS